MFSFVLGHYDTETRTGRLFFLGPILMDDLFWRNSLVRLVITFERTVVLVMPMPTHREYKATHLFHLSFKGHPQLFSGLTQFFL